MLQKVSQGEVFEKATMLGDATIKSGDARLVTDLEDKDLIPVERVIVSMYLEASKENYRGNNIQFFDNEKWILYNEPYYEEDKFVGVYSVRLESAEVIRTMQNTEKPF